MVLVSITLPCKMSFCSMRVRTSSTLRNKQTAEAKPIFGSLVRTYKLTATWKYPAASRMAPHLHFFKPNIWDRPKSNNMELINSIIRKKEQLDLGYSMMCNSKRNKLCPLRASLKRTLLPRRQLPMWVSINTVSKTPILLSGEDKAFQDDAQSHQTFIITQSQTRLPRASIFPHTVAGCTPTDRRSWDVFWQGMLGAPPGTRKAARPLFCPVTSYGRRSHSLHSPCLLWRVLEPPCGSMVWTRWTWVTLRKTTALDELLEMVETW